MGNSSWSAFALAMNRIFIVLAAILSSGIFAYSYWKEWLGIKFFGMKMNVFPDHPQAPYYHASESLYLGVLLVFAILFSLVFSGAVWFTFKKNWTGVFVAFLLSMLLIFAVMINGAIK